MGRTVSGKELEAGQHEFDFNLKNRTLIVLAEGKRKLKEGCKEVITVAESLISKTTHQRNRLLLGQSLAPEFKKFAGKKANTERIFEKNNARKREEVVAL